MLTIAAAMFLSNVYNSKDEEATLMESTTLSSMKI